MTDAATVFPEWPDLRPLGDRGETFLLLRPYLYRPEGILVPAGFVHNMASVPRRAWSLVGPFDLGPGALVHDYTYSPTDDRVVRALTRRRCDEIFRRMMLERNVDPRLAEKAYWLVRLFGFSHFRKAAR